AQTGAPPDAPAPVDVIGVSGRVDAIEAHFVVHSIEDAERAGSQLLVVQLDSPGAVISEAQLDKLASRIRQSSVPVGVWIGPNGSRAYGGAVRLLRAAATSGMANGTHVGRFRDPCPE